MSDGDAAPLDVVVAGGGPAGLAAGLFTARYGLATRVFDRGKSLLRQCARLENVLGFPEGLRVADYLERARAHARGAGCTLLGERVTALQRGADGCFEICTHSGSRFRAERVVAATPLDCAYLDALLPGVQDADAATRAGHYCDREGRTAQPGLYLAGRLAGCADQALACAGHGAQVALAVIRDQRRGLGYWDALAAHVDWRIRAGQCEGERWERRVREYFLARAPEQVVPAQAQFLIDAWIRAKRAQQLERRP